MKPDNQMDTKVQINGVEILRWFSPRWFIFIMGTGAMANVFKMLSKAPGDMAHMAAIFFLCVALAALPVVILLMAIRFFISFDSIYKEWHHSNLIQFYPAISIAAAITAAGLFTINVPFFTEAGSFGAGVILWWFACLTGVFFIFLIPYMVITKDHAEPRKVLGFWFLPPVGLFVLIFSGNVMALRIDDVQSVHTLLLFNTLLMGVAVILTIIIYTIFIYRIFLYDLPKGDVAPSFMIGLAPMGVSIIAINTILPVIHKAGFMGVEIGVLFFLVKIVSLLIWGFGLWWLLMVIGLTTMYFLKHTVPVTLGYWAFVFPPAAFAAASFIVGKSWGIVPIQYFSAGLIMAVVLVWFINLVLTIKGILNGSIFDVSSTFKG